MPGIVRTGDLCSCICCCHPPIPCVATIGVFVAGAGTVTAEGASVVRIGDMAICSCGHPTFLVGGSSTVTAEGVAVGRLGDPVAACPVGNVITSAGTVTNSQ